MKKSARSPAVDPASFDFARASYVFMGG